ncbi:DUF4129 domain-containing protein [Sphingomonas sp. AAP5]|uniref:DUF4129 domain-containing protein n=1 Tax=unclassified Sphingomonas TaxID=196159 RepID=UPI00105710AB|nr:MULTISPECIES: DUF4129 domain-containing protein [unclassified Sphingomonas]QBM76306.1 DUF4129 domain-containing protein [Sphingomonas sp. AAP5]
MSEGTSQVATATDRFAAAHAALKADPAVQFTLQRAPPPPQPPEWLVQLGKWLGKLFEPVGRALLWIGSRMPHWPYARILLWGVLGLVAIAILWAVYTRVRHGEWRWPRFVRRRPTVSQPIDEAWAPDAAPVHEWLREADLLAAEGRYAEAVHHLLRRSIDDIARRRPQLVRPALTSRELSASSAIPFSARDLFAGIARLVERSLFGGRPVDASDWTQARAAYRDFALPGSWRG